MYPNNLYFPYQMGINMPYNIPFMKAKTSLFSRLGNGLGAFKTINWTNIINNTSKTLGVINQAIPIVKQTGPMLHNMRSMLRVASVFRDETSNKPNKKKNNSSSNNNINEKKEVQTSNDSLPNFFI